MTEAPQPTVDSGRWIRAALVILPAGTILLGIASFGIWQWKKDQAADRSFRYAMALRRPISQAGIQRHADIVREALGKPDWQLSIPGYLQSTMGAENMGYTVRRARFTEEQSTIDAELTGKTRPRDIVLALVPYNQDPLRFERTAQAVAEVLSVAHELTGQSVTRSLRFAILPNTPEAVKDLKQGLERDSERVMHLFVLGGQTPETIKRLRDILETTRNGTLIIDRPATTTTEQTLLSAQALKTQLLQAATSL